MSDQSPYEQLGVTEDASFDEIQAARSRLIDLNDDRQAVERIEMAYDAVLMDRLRLRQEGKIKVPEGIRFPERVMSPPPKSLPEAPSNRMPEWLQGAIDTPSQSDILLPAGVFAALSVFSAIDVAYVPICLALGAGASLYFLNRKEKRFGRAVLFTLIGVIVGILIGGQLATLLGSQLQPQIIAAWLTFFLLWLTSSYLR
ncbi:molecular chaperone DnaJ [Geitlerinema sp. P-1104]|uniref:CPP1-like family protein n=1 Tax=Geitlerinema sp. P-1104 TaxID=2546230 RepID=UPI001476BA0B|nr:CPP1-like family protein [Geitlerinema sp. P-1104]NMG59530.1 molecular chaperone DnaJ [Geitlerinema sp. P-1104]